MNPKPLLALNHFTIPCSLLTTFLFSFLSYLVLLELPPAEKKGRQVSTCSPFNESKGFTRATNAKATYHIPVEKASAVPTFLAKHGQASLHHLRRWPRLRNSLQQVGTALEAILLFRERVCARAKRERMPHEIAYEFAASREFISTQTAGDSLSVGAEKGDRSHKGVSYDRLRGKWGQVTLTLSRPLSPIKLRPRRSVPISALSSHGSSPWH